MLLLTSNDYTKIESVKSFENEVTFQAGDLIFRYGNGFFSEQFRKYSSVHEKIYSHVGVINIESDSIVVFHSEASELTGIGLVKKEPLCNFLKDIDTYGVYRIDCHDSIKTKIIKKVNFYYQKKTKFDLHFDSTNDDEVYCTELVANAINFGFGEKIITPKIKFKDKLLYGVDNLYLNDGFYLVNRISKITK